MIKKKNKGAVIWLTGLPCSGKTTIAKKLEKYFLKKKILTQRIDGDVLRETVCADLSFSREDRKENIRRAAHIARMFSEKGFVVVVALVSPYREMRKMAKKICPNLIEVYVKCSLEECKKRDVKGMYKKAMRGGIKNFTGVDDPYEEPLKPDLVIDTEKISATKNAEKTFFIIEKSCSKKPRKTEYFKHT